MFSSTHVRLTRTSSDLRLLAATLCPPSPILTSNDLVLSPSTSGEIPLVIDFLIDELSAPLNSPLRFECGHEIYFPPKASRPDIDAIVCALDRIVEHPMATSSKFPNLASLHSTNDSLPDEVFFTPKSSLSSQSLDSAPSPTCDFRFQVTHARSSDSVSSSSSDSSSTKTVLGDTTQAWVFDSESTCNAVMAAEDKEDEAQHVLLGTSATFSTLPTLSFAPPSPSPSVDVISPISLTYSESRRHRKPLERSGAIHHPKMLRSIPRSPRLLLRAHGLREPTSSDTGSECTTHWQLIDFPSTSFIQASACTTSKSPTIYPYLPHDLAWLGGTEIELWIDQQGFRAIRPMMRLMGYSPRSRSLLPYGERSISSDVSGGVAEFMPVKRESFAFHHAALDGSPMLRRITVGGDESRDYLSRHAALHVKTNGVYTVLGSESMALGGSQDTRTQWKFDYLVDDRYADGGRVLTGEKIITPLTFSCSPFLLHPLQGRKVGFMHLMKKNVVPKLSAEKLEPPENVGLLSQGLRMAGLRRTGTHRPSRSEVHANPRSVHLSANGALVGSSPLEPSNDGRIFEGTRQMHYTWRRRASSAGEHGSVQDCLHHS